MTPEKIYKKGLCLGCGICNSITEEIRVEFNQDDTGRYKPKSDTKKKIKNLEKICPGIFIENDKPLLNFNQLIWGHYKNIYEGYATDDEIRFKGSSGGTLTAMAVFLLEKKIVDGILQMEGTDVPLKYSLTVSKTKEDLIKNTGSKYIVSDYLRNIRDILKKNFGTFAFIGKPCDISAVKQLLKYDETLRDRVKIYFSFFCAGLPTLKTIDKICNAFGIKSKEILKINFRGNGWPGEFKIITNDRKEYSLSYDNSWGKFLGKDIHFRCKICPDGVGKLADISFGDAWEIKENKPDFSEKPGKSLILSRTEIGSQLLNKAHSYNYIKIFDYDIDLLKINQKYQFQRHEFLAGRLLGYKLFIKRYPIFSKLGIITLIFRTNYLQQLKNFWGTFKRNIERL